MTTPGTKFEAFVEHLAAGVHDLMGSGEDIDDLRIYLTNDAPSASAHETKSDVAEISDGDGYSSGGESVTPSGSRTNGTVTVEGDEVTWTASGGSIGPFRYVVLYNDDPTDPEDPLIVWWDQGTEITLSDGESFTWRPDGEQSDGTILTIS